MGATAYGNGSPSLAGIYANFSLADAIFQPLAAQQLVGARRQAAAAVQNDTLLRVAVAYLDLSRAIQEAAIARESRNLTQQLVELTGNFAKAGEGLQADADRMQAELTVRLNDVERAQEGITLSSARLAELLRLDPATSLAPIEPSVVPIEMTPPNVPVRGLIAEGLSQRPELAEQRALVGAAAERLRGEEMAPWLPHVVLGVSEGDMSAGEGTPFSNLQDRFDFDAIAYWELRNFAFGERAAREESRSQMQQAQIHQFDVADRIAREIVETYAQVQARRNEIDTAHRGIQSALDSHRRNLERIQAAKGLPIEALQSVQALVQARREYLRAVYDFDVAQFSLYRAIGAPVLCYSERITPPPAARPIPE
jgi:outer membrane protein TolC